ncbi:MAG: DAK2 domain-containing protein, partial [Actinobacteria bacterium]|nr:DAK2 domain-containing protein [Actinomycetota bacterium]
SVGVPGGQTMNPSIEELVRAVSRGARTGAILLPNNPNVIMTAQQAGALVRADLRVVPTRTIPEGVAAMIAFNPEADLGTNEEAMRRAAAAVQTIEVTRAVRSTRANGLEIKEGQGIAILNGVLVEAGDSLDEIIRRALDRAAVGEHEVATIYCGEGVSLEEGRCLAASINARWPDVQVEVVEGGQPHYPYILSVE